jgi:hypothetical protein
VGKHANKRYAPLFSPCSGIASIAGSAQVGFRPNASGRRY